MLCHIQQAILPALNELFILIYTFITTDERNIEQSHRSQSAFQNSFNCLTFLSWKRILCVCNLLIILVYNETFVLLIVAIHCCFKNKTYPYYFVPRLALWDVIYSDVPGPKQMQANLQ